MRFASVSSLLKFHFFRYERVSNKEYIDGWEYMTWKYCDIMRKEELDWGMVCTCMQLQWYLGIRLFLTTNISAYEPSLEEIFVPRYE